MCKPSAGPQRRSGRSRRGEPQAPPAERAAGERRWDAAARLHGAFSLIADDSAARWACETDGCADHAIREPLRIVIGQRFSALRPADGRVPPASSLAAEAV